MQETLGAVGSFMSGKAANAQAKGQAALAERQAQDVDLQALQSSEAHREQLLSAMSTIEARRASSGAGLDTPSAVAISKEMQRQSARAENIDQVGYNNQKVALRTGAKLKLQAGKSALTAGYLSAASGLAGAAGSMSSAIKDAKAGYD